MDCSGQEILKEEEENYTDYVAKEAEFDETNQDLEFPNNKM